MSTFITTARMNPALRARVERAVSHRAAAKRNAKKMGMARPFASREPPKLARWLTFFAAVLVVGLGGAMYLQARKNLMDEREALLSAIEEKRAGLPLGHEEFVASLDRWVVDAASETSAADVIEPSLKAEGVLDEWLKKPAVYVRGEGNELKDAAKLDDAGQASIKDAFLFCLLKPAVSASEGDLLNKVRGVYFGGAKVDDQTANVRRLAEARLGLSVLSGTFEKATRAAEDLQTLRKLRKDLQTSPTDEGKKAARAEVLMVLVESQVQEGKREAQFSMIDLKEKKIVLRARRFIDPVGKSAMAQIHRGDLEGCGLAMAMRGVVSN